jgi:dTDP-4-dehydrorhamnose reductase
MQTDKINIIVLGSSGQLGMAIKDLFDQRKETFFVKYFDRKKINLSRKPSIEKLKDYTFDILINTAAYTAVDKAETQRQRCAKINALALEELAAICSKKKALLIHFSTDYVYDNDLRRPLLETDPTEPKSTYAITKLLGEKLLRALTSKHIIIRTSWLYYHDGKNFLNTMLHLSSIKEELSIVDDQVGAPTYVVDLAQAVIAIIEKYTQIEDPNFLHGTYNYSNSGSTTWYDFAKKIFELTQVKIKIKPIVTEHYPTPANRPRYSVMNTDKIAKILDYPIPSWEDGLRRCLVKKGY